MLPSTNKIKIKGATKLFRAFFNIFMYGSPLLIDGAISGLKKATIKIYKIYKTTIINPGITAALNRSPTLICITAPSIINTILGGISCPNVPLAAITPLASLGE